MSPRNPVPKGPRGPKPKPLPGRPTYYELQQNHVGESVEIADIQELEGKQFMSPRNPVPKGPRGPKPKPLPGRPTYYELQQNHVGESVEIVDIQELEDKQFMSPNPRPVGPCRPKPEPKPHQEHVEERIEIADTQEFNGLNFKQLIRAVEAGEVPTRRMANKNFKSDRWKRLNSEGSYFNNLYQMFGCIIEENGLFTESSYKPMLDALRNNIEACYTKEFAEFLIGGLGKGLEYTSKSRAKGEASCKRDFIAVLSTLYFLQENRAREKLENHPTALKRLAAALMLTWSGRRDRHFNRLFSAPKSWSQKTGIKESKLTNLQPLLQQISAADNISKDEAKEFVMSVCLQV